MERVKELIKVSPSLLASDFSCLRDEINRVKNADMLHIDVMDGHFVPNISIGIPVVESISKITDMLLDVHLMISHPADYAEAFAKAGAGIICFHLEADSDISSTVNIIRSTGVSPAIAIKPSTPAAEVLPFLPLIDMILVLTVEPGFGGQAFMPEMLGKISMLRSHIDSNGYNVSIQVDGGINLQTAAMAAEAGADILVAGSAVFSSSDSSAVICRLKEISR